MPDFLSQSADQRRPFAGALLVAALAGALGPADPFGIAVADIVFRALAAAGATWLVLHLTASVGSTGAALAGRALVAAATGVVVSGLDGPVAPAAWSVIGLAVIALGPPLARRILVTLGIVAAVAGAAGAIALARTAVALESAGDRTAGLDELVLAEPDTARRQLDLVRADLDDARSALDPWWARPARLVPVLSRHFQFADTAMDVSDDLVTAANPLIDTDPEDLIVTGRVDVEAVALLSGRVGDAGQRADAASRALRAHDREWLVGPADKALAKTLSKIDDFAEQLNRLARHSSGLLPHLGTDGPSRWFVLACTPAEARATCGFPTDWIEIEIDDGRATLVDSDSMAELEELATAAGLELPPGSKLARYHPRFEPVPTLRNITMTPDFPATADAMHDVLVTLGRPAPDVVAAVNTDGLEALLRIMGPVDAGAMGRLTAGNVRPRLDIEQYEQFDSQAAGREAHQDAMWAIFDKLTTLEMFNTSRIRRLAEPIERGGFLASVPHDPGNVFVDMGMAGALTADPLAAVTVQNAGANKLDAFRSVAMTLTPATKTRAGCATIVIGLGTAPPGTAGYAVGNEVELPDGWIRSWVSVYTPTPVTSARLDGRPVAVEPGSEGGHPVIGLFVDTGPSSSVTLSLDLEPGASAPPETRYQPSVEPFTTELTTTCPP